LSDILVLHPIGRSGGHRKSRVANPLLELRILPEEGFFGERPGIEIFTFIPPLATNQEILDLLAGWSSGRGGRRPFKSDLATAPCQGRIRRSADGALNYRRPAPSLVSLSAAGKN
jgi:hypothetical protein